MTAPVDLPALAAISDPTERAHAATAYIAAHEQMVDEARQIRDQAILTLLDTQGPTAVAQAVGMSLSHIRNVQRWMSGSRGAPH